MDTIIGSTYQVIRKLGSGGGGVVYLANHIRLGKQVVLKADKRQVTAHPEILRREVDVLKNLKHKYIPQVHDFFIENDVVYTSMEFIQGESLDRPLKRGEKFSQPQVIQWAIQLLEALDYLHSPNHGDPPRGYVHSDIKPANIMRTPHNDICLIDFNIALALGEENVIGHSPGYASPEHYGLDYSMDSDTKTVDSDETVTLSNDDSTVTLPHTPGIPHRKKVLPDVRSDIYSLGATLYHLLSGEKPATNAKEVIPLSKTDFSPLVVDIISKAMNPNPNLRYQTAADMLEDFRSLHRRDPRVIRLKRQKIISGCLFLSSLVLGIAMTFVGLKRMQTVESWYKLAEYSANAYSQGDMQAAADYALQAIPNESSILLPAHIPEAQKALTDALGVYNLSDGYKPFSTIDLPSNPLYMELASDGKTAVVLYDHSFAVIDVTSSKIIRTLPSAGSALCEAHYINDETIVYAGESGISAYSIPSDSILWVGSPATAICIAPDAGTVAAINKGDQCARVYDSLTGAVKYTVDFDGKNQDVQINENFANPNNHIFTLSADAQWLAVSFSDGTLSIFNLLDRSQDLSIYDASSGYTHFEGGFFEQYFAFSSTKEGESVFAVVDIGSAEQTGGFTNDSYFSVYTNSSGIYVQTKNLLVKIHPVTGEQTPLITFNDTVTKYAISSNSTLIASNHSYLFFRNAQLLEQAEWMFNCDFLQISNTSAVIGSLDTPTISILHHESHKEAQFFQYDNQFIHDEARISDDGQTVMLFRYDGFQLYSIDGTLITEVSIPDAGKVYDQQYRRNNGDSYLEVTYQDGRLVSYSAKDGSIIDEKQIETPDPSLYQEFYTDQYRIAAPLHETPSVYNIETGEFVCSLEKDAYLTYVTQQQDYIITQYITTDGSNFAYLLNEKCEVLAFLPHLCDIVGDYLYFDYPEGSICQSKIYSLDELIAIAQENYIGG